MKIPVDIIRQFLGWGVIANPISNFAGNQDSPTVVRITTRPRSQLSTSSGNILLATRRELEKSSLKPSRGHHSPSSDEEIQWTSISRILDWNVATKQLLLVLVISVVIMQAILLLIGLASDGKLILLPWNVLGTVFGILVTLMLLAVLVLGNRQVMEVTVNEDGLRYKIGARARSLSRMAIIFGGISASAGTVGAGLLAESRSSGFIRWSAVARVRVNLRRRSLVLWSDSLPLIEVFCNPEVVDPVLAIFRRNVKQVEEC